MNICSRRNMQKAFEDKKYWHGQVMQPEPLSLQSYIQNIVAKISNLTFRYSCRDHQT